ncbi:MAG: helix-turn-helix domain-containing protein [Thermoleophilaceae bacterium]
MKPPAPDAIPLLCQRLGLGLTREEVAQRVGLDPVTVWRAKTGRAAPRRSTRLLLAAALRCDPAALFPDAHGKDAE